MISLYNYQKPNTLKSISNQIGILLLILLTVFGLTLSGCEKAFDPPNKEKIETGEKDGVVPVGTALKMKKYADAMAKTWNEEAVLMEVNGINIGIDGYNQTNLSSSQWIFTYFSPKKEPMINAYTITFDGKGRTTWLQNGGGYLATNNIGNFAIDSDKALLTADKSGLPQGKIYTVELRKNDKGTTWVVGSKLDEAASKYEIKRVDALSGNVIQ